MTLSLLQSLTLDSRFFYAIRIDFNACHSA